MKAQLFLTFCAVSLSVLSVRAQAPAQPTAATAYRVPAAAAVPPTVTGGTQDAASTAAMLKALQQLKSANDELLKRQAAALQRIEEIEKTAEQVKVYSGGTQRQP
jgi:hypothetical protein